MIAQDTWDSFSSLAATELIFITWEPLHPSILKINFDGNVSDGGSRKGAGFVIRVPDLRLIAIGGSRIYDTYVPGVELRVA